MKVSDLLESRRENWRELERMCMAMGGRSRRRFPAGTAVRFAALYRAACADLALAYSYQLPPGTIHYLHRLVGRAHNQLYRSRTFDFSGWFRELMVRVPRRLFTDNSLRLAFVIFWGIFVLSMIMTRSWPGYAEEVIKEQWMQRLEADFSGEIFGRSVDQSTAMAGFYIQHNAGIGLRCFAFGLLLGLGGLYMTVYNAAFLGAVFGYMTTVPEQTRNNFFEFVTAHGPFELTAIVLSAAAGMRMGFALIDTQGFTRIASLRRAALRAVPVMSAAVVMFLLAAMIEAFLSPSAAPYPIKAGMAVLSTGMLMFYFVILGYAQRETDRAVGP